MGALVAAAPAIGAISGIIGAGATVASLAMRKTPKPLAPQPVATRDDAAAATQVDDALRRRRGSAADMLLGPAGAEAAPTPTKVLLGE